VMLLLSSFFGATAGVAGAMVSVTQARLPTGPMVILSLTLIVVVSILFAPRHGLIVDRVRRWRLAGARS